MNTDTLQKSGVCKRGNSAIGESPRMRQRSVEFGDRDSHRRKFRESLPHTLPFLHGRGVQRSSRRTVPPPPPEFSHKRPVNLVIHSWEGLEDQERDHMFSWE